MSINNNIPEEHLVIVNGRPRDKRDANITQDFETGEWMDLTQDQYHTVNTVEFEKEGFFKTKYSYLKRKNNRDYNLYRATIQHNKDYPTSFKSFYFKNEESFNEFCKKYDLVRGENNRETWFQKNLIKYDRKKPTPFNNIKHKRVVEDYLNGEIYIDEKRAKTKEYKELLDIVNIENKRLGLDSSSFKAFEGLNFSYGIELETISGCIYNDIYLDSNKDLNMAGVFDGSLRDPDGSGPWGQEYITGVLKGDSGLKQLYDITKLISSKCKVDKRCAFHVHIGSLNWNSEDIVYMYLLGLMLEDEVFSIMPLSRRNNEYCKSLPTLNKTKVARLVSAKNKVSYKKAIDGLYDNVFKIVGRQGSPNRFSNKKTAHPKGRHGGYDRGTDHRYSWLNFTNMVFNQRGSLNDKTIEFRPHPGTLSYKKIYNWLKICMAIAEFVHIGKRDIVAAIKDGKKITLEDIISKVYKRSSSSLVSYIQIRKNLFSDFSNENIDYVNEESNIKNLKELVCV